MHPIADDFAKKIIQWVRSGDEEVIDRIQVGLRDLYKNRLWLQCGCTPESETPSWVLTTRAHRVFLRRHVEATHDIACPHRKCETPVPDRHAPESTRAELRLRRWRGPFHVCFSRTLGDAADLERLADGRLVYRHHLLARMLRELLCRAELDRINVDKIKFIRGIIDGRHHQKLLRDASRAAGVFYLRDSEPKSRLIKVPIAGSSPQHRIVLFTATSFHFAPDPGGGTWVVLRDAKREDERAVPTAVRPRFDASTQTQEGPFLAIGVVVVNNGQNVLADVVLTPVLEPHIFLPVDHSDDRKAIRAVFSAARAAMPDGPTRMTLHAPLFDDLAAMPDANRDGVYVLAKDEQVTYLSQHPSHGRWMDMSHPNSGALHDRVRDLAKNRTPVPEAPTSHSLTRKEPVL